jgi:hypothetical protein
MRDPMLDAARAASREVISLDSFDANDWARVFCRINPTANFEEMREWFASALARGYEEGQHTATLVGGPCPGLKNAIDRAVRDV